MVDKANLILKGNNIFTSEGTDTISGAVIVKGDKILAVEKDVDKIEAYISPDTQIVDCGDKLIMPGFVDSHVHFLMASLLRSSKSILLFNIPSEKECAQAVYDFIKARPEIKKLFGFGWLVEFWEPGSSRPTKKSLDDLGIDIPVYLQGGDGHSWWLNSAALNELGISASDECSFGEYGKLENGELSGYILEIDAGTPAMNKAGMLDRAELKELVKGFWAEMNSCGITSIAEVAACTYYIKDYYHYGVYDELNRENPDGNPVRMFLFPVLDKNGNLEFAKKLREKYSDDKVKISGLKQFVDGVPFARTDYPSEGYSDRPDIVTKPFFSEEKLTELVTTANKEGFSVRMHTISDGAIKIGLNVYEAAQKVAGASKITNTLEHVNEIAPEDIERFAKLNVIPDFQPGLMLLTKDYFNTLYGEERSIHSFMDRAMLDSGATLAYSTDHPCTIINPFFSIYLAVTRCDPAGTPLTINPEQAVTLGEALRAYTYGGACACGEKDKIGTLEPGKYADILVVDGAVFGEKPGTWLDRKSYLTISSGKIVYSLEEENKKMEQEVRKVIDNYIEGSYTADKELLESVFHKNAVMNGYMCGQIMLATPQAFIDNVMSSPSMKDSGVDYSTEIESVEVTDKIATVRIREHGFAGNLDFVDCFHLIYEDGEWSIISKLFTTI